MTRSKKQEKHFVRLEKEIIAINKNYVSEQQGQNSEKKIAQAILDAQKMREESYVWHKAHGNFQGFGEYTKSIENCLIETCKQQNLSSNLWHLLSLAMHWWNDIQLWAEDILAGKNILEECEKEKAKMKAKMKDDLKRVGDVADEDSDVLNKMANVDDSKYDDDTSGEYCPCDHASKDACDQCQEIDIANPHNH